MLPSEYYDIISPILIESLEKQAITPKKKNPKFKSYEAEDAIVRPKPVLKRQLSHPNLKTACLDKFEEKNGQLWNCIKCKLDTHGGTIYTFRVKHKYDILKDRSKYPAYQQKSNDIYPAIESISKPFLFLHADQNRLDAYLQDCRKIDPTDADHEYIFLQNVFDARSALKKLGYDYQCHQDGNLLSLPDRVALLARWSLLKEKLPSLPPLDDAEVQARAIKNFPQLETVLGILVDGLSGEARPDHLRPSAIAEDTIDWLLGEYIHQSKWLGYMQRRYGAENVLSPEEMKELWALINTIVNMY